MRRRQFIGWMVAGVANLLVVGCKPRVEQTVSVTSTSPPAPTHPPTPTVTPTAVPTPTSAPEPTPTEEVKVVTFTIAYDNNAYDPALRTAWGFSCLVETGDATVLFDTGGDSPTLLDNMTKLGIDPQAIDVVVLSHIHGDHTGGLTGLLDTGVQPTVYVPAAFPASFKNSVRTRTDLVEVTGPVEILPGVHTTGEVGSGIIEQALAVETGDGLVVVTGCAHPGVVEMVRRAVGAWSPRPHPRPYLVLGGFHLGGASKRQVERIIADFRDLGVQKVAPCHCTGDQAIGIFAEEYGEDFIRVGVGCVITIPDSFARSNDFSRSK